MQSINWYPGHMAKAKRQLEEDLKLIEVVVEVVDARAPSACRNPDFEELFRNKRRVVILNKSDLASPSANKEWIRCFSSCGITAVEYVSTGGSSKKAAVAVIEKAGEDVIARYRARGVSKTLRAMVVGIPNVGKSTFINRIAGVVKAQVGDRPGVTRSKQWVKVSPYLELMDTPGLLWARLDSQVYARHIAYIGSIRDDILDIEELAEALLSDLLKLCPDELISRYPKIDKNASDDELLAAVCRSRGFVLSKGMPDTERAARIVLDEFRAGKIARVSFELPSDQIVTEPQ